MNNKQFLLRGTLILTLTGFLSRIIGFFYRIFLSQTIGAEGMGIYQLIFPIHSVCFAVAVGGIQTAISRFVAARTALKDEQGARDIFFIGTFLSVLLSLLMSWIVYRNSPYIAAVLLGEERCVSLLQLMALSVPFGTFHSCVNGYYYAKKSTVIPAATQLLEQCARVAASYLFYLVLLRDGRALTPMIAVVGILGGELVSMIAATLFILWDFNKASYQLSKMTTPFHHLKEIITLSVPLTGNRLLINLLNSVEAILIPGRLRMFGLDNTSALSIYGILTGMSLPLILFPSAITNSVSVMLLPAIAEEQAKENHAAISKTIGMTIKYCLILGFLSTGFFFFLGDTLGMLLFKNEFAGTFIKTLSFICPCLYLSTTLTSILNGLGSTTLSFVQNTIGLVIRILFVLFIIPTYGIQGYLWGLLVSELAISGLSLFFLRKYIDI